MADLSPAPKGFGASIGIATAGAGSLLTAERLIRMADVAIYRATEAGSNQIVEPSAARSAEPAPRFLLHG